MDATNHSTSLMCSRCKTPYFLSKDRIWTSAFERSSYWCEEYGWSEDWNYRIFCPVCWKDYDSWLSVVSGLFKDIKTFDIGEDV
jgi:hypothetical protein